MHTTVDFLRHGAVQGGAYYRGSTDDPLSKLGWQQMHAAVAKKEWDLIVCSPLMRCLDFAQTLSQQSNTPLLIESDWQEIHFGDWEGKTAEQIEPDELKLFYQDPMNNSPRNAEIFSAFLARINRAWQCLIEENPGKQVLVITHAGVIRALFPLLLNLPVNKLFNLQVEHASMTRFQCFQDQQENYIQLEFHNLASKTLGK